MRSVEPAVMSALLDWDAGERRLAERVPERDARMAVLAAVDGELRRRVGPSYSLGDLLRAYSSSSGWFLVLAERTAPLTPAAWEPSVALDAAFARWARNATDGVVR